MSTLSKQVIQWIAEQMTKKSKLFMDESYNHYKEVATEIYEAAIPEEVMVVFKKYPDYLQTSSSFYADSHGFSREFVSMTKQLPSKYQWRDEIKLSSKTADRLMAAKRKYEKAQKEYKELVQETESALAALKTAKNIR